MQVIKALDKLKRVANWVGMTIPTEQYCKVCQQSKLPMPPSAHMTNAPIGRPWQMLAVDVLEVHHVQQRKLISTGASRSGRNQYQCPRKQLIGLHKCLLIYFHGLVFQRSCILTKGGQYCKEHVQHLVLSSLGQQRMVECFNRTLLQLL